jgi:hypothetical protein
MTKDAAIDAIADEIGTTNAEKAWPVVVEMFARWIEDRPGLLPVQPEDLSRQLREEMT